MGVQITHSQLGSKRRGSHSSGIKGSWLEASGCSLRASQDSGEEGPSSSCPRVRFTGLNWMFWMTPPHPLSVQLNLRERAHMRAQIRGTCCSETGAPPVPTGR